MDLNALAFSIYWEQEKRLTLNSGGGSSVWCGLHIFKCFPQHACVSMCKLRGKMLVLCYI